MRKIDASSQAAWTTGRLVFVNEKLFDILKSIEKNMTYRYLCSPGKSILNIFQEV